VDESLKGSIYCDWSKFYSQNKFVKISQN